MSDLDMLPQTLNDGRWTAWTNPDQTDPLIDPDKMSNLLKRLSNERKVSFGPERWRTFQIKTSWGRISACNDPMATILDRISWSIVLNQNPPEKKSDIVPQKNSGSSVRKFFWVERLIELPILIVILMVLGVPAMLSIAAINVEILFLVVRILKAYDKVRTEEDRAALENPPEKWTIPLDSDSRSMAPTLIRLLDLTTDETLTESVLDTVDRLVKETSDEVGTTSHSFWKSNERLLVVMGKVVRIYRDSPFEEETRQALKAALDILGTSVPVMDDTRHRISALESGLSIYLEQTEKSRRAEILNDREMRGRSLLENVLDPVLNSIALPSAITSGTDENFTKDDGSGIEDLSLYESMKLSMQTESAEVLTQLSRSDHVEVRRIVAWNEYTPEDVLEELSDDDDPAVLGYVIGNPNTPGEVVRKVRKARDHKDFDDPDIYLTRPIAPFDEI